MLLMVSQVLDEIVYVLCHLSKYKHLDYSFNSVVYAFTFDAFNYLHSH